MRSREITQKSLKLSCDGNDCKTLAGGNVNANAPTPVVSDAAISALAEARKSQMELSKELDRLGTIQSKSEENRHLREMVGERMEAAKVGGCSSS